MDRWYSPQARPRGGAGPWVQFLRGRKWPRPESGADRDETGPRPSPTPRLVSADRANWNGMQPSHAHTHALPPIHVVGSGRVGTAVQRAARAAGVDVTLAGRGDLERACA